MRKPLASLTAVCLGLVAGAVYAQGNNMEAGKQVYEKSCARCHNTGKMGAPELDDMAEWADRGQMLWSDVHLQHLDEGFLRDAADDSKKGITQEQMEAANNYMVFITTKK